MLSTVHLRKIVETALEEDIGGGDITTSVTESGAGKATGRFVAREDFIVAGLPVAEEVFRTLGGTSGFRTYAEEGSPVSRDECIAEITAPAGVILSGERTALNFLGKLSGIATAARKCTDLLKPYNAKILDTRKTTPLLRMLEKYAVRTGGGNNHRTGLYDGILIKDNHIAAAGGIKEALGLAKKNAPHTLKIEIEVENLDQLREAVESGADAVLLDNMTVENMRKAVEICGGKIVTEASGGITMDKLETVAKTGVDYISAGFLTHSARSVDISLQLTGVERT